MNVLVRVARSRTLRWLPVAVLIAGFAEVGLRYMQLPRLCQILGVRLEFGDTADVSVPPEESGWRRNADEAARYRAAARALAVWPWGGDGACLRLALVAGCLLRHRSPALHIGVAKIEGDVAAHAWLTIDGIVLDPTARSYAPLRGRAV